METKNAEVETTQKSAEEEHCQKSDSIGPRKTKSVIKDQDVILIIICLQHVISSYHLIIISQAYQHKPSRKIGLLIDFHLTMSSLSTKMSLAQQENKESLK